MKKKFGFYKVQAFLGKGWKTFIKTANLDVAKMSRVNLQKQYRDVRITKA